MNRLLVLIASVLLPAAVHGAADNIAWCYHDSSCNDATWHQIATQYCNGSRQSPIDIVSASAMDNPNLTSFSFTKYGDQAALTKIKNTGMTVKVELTSGVQVSGGGLSEAYDSIQFHLHWGNRSSVPGSEHTVDGKRYPMEMHIVNVKSSLNLNTTLAVADGTGLAALGFFIDVKTGNQTNYPASWNSLANLLSSIQTKGTYANITAAVSLDDLVAGVDRTKFWRYLGGLTTPACNEAVVWTVFKDPILVSQDVIDKFSTTVHINTTTNSLLMTNVFRNVQALNGRTVYSTPRASTTAAPTTTASASSLGGTKTWASLVFVSLAWILRRP